MSRAMSLHWFPTLCSDIPVKLVLGIGKLSPPGKAMRIVAALDMRPKSLNGQNQSDCAMKDAFLLDPEWAEKTKQRNRSAFLSG